MSVIIHFRGKKKRERGRETELIFGEMKNMFGKKSPLQIVIPLCFWIVSIASHPGCLSMNES